MGYLLVCAAAAAALWLLGKRRKMLTGVRLNSSVATGGVLLMALGGLTLAAPFGGAMDALALGVAVAGAGLVAWYLRFSVTAQEDGFLWQTLTARNHYRYDTIVSQQLYVTTGGVALVELHLADGKALLLQGNMEGVAPFLDLAFDRWMAQKGLTLADCPFHDPRKNQWFPETEA